MKRLFLILFLLLILPVWAWGATVYVTPDSEVATAICYRSGAWPVIAGGVCQAPATKNSSISDGALVTAGAGGIVVLDGGVVGGAGKTYTDAQLGSSNQIRWQANGQTITGATNPIYYDTTHGGTVNLVTTGQNINRIWADGTGPKYQYLTMSCPAANSAMNGKTSSDHVTVLGPCAALVSVSGDLTGDTTHNYLIVKNSEYESGAINLLTAGITTTFNYPWFENNGVALGEAVIYQTNGTCTVNNGLSIGNKRSVFHLNGAEATMNINNHSIVANGYLSGTNPTIENGTGILNLNTSLALPGKNTTYFTSGTITESGVNVYKSPLFISPRRELWVSFGLDDYCNWSDFKTLTTYLAPWKGFFSLNQLYGVTTADWSEMAAYIANGHEIANHTFNHWTNMATSLNAFTISSTAGSPYITISATQTEQSSNDWTGTLKMYEGGTTEGHLVKTVNLANHSKDSSYARTIAELKTMVEAQSGWTLTVHADLGASTSVEPICLDSHAQQDVSGAGHLFTFNKQALWWREVAEAKKEIETKIGGGYVAKTFVSPGNGWSQDFADWIYNSTNYPTGTLPHESILIDGDGTAYLSSDYTLDSAGIKPFKILRLTPKNDILKGSTEANAYRDVQGVAEFGAYAGTYFTIYDHSFSSETTAQQWQWVIAALKQLGYVKAKLPRDAITDIKTNGTIQSGEGTSSVLYSLSFNNNSNYRLRSGSPAINAGTDVGLTTDFLNKPIRGIPDIGAYEFQTVQGGFMMGLGVGF